MKEIERITIWGGTFINFQKVIYEDKDGNIREWECVSRKGDQEAVTIIAWLRVSKKLIVIKQYRPPIDAYEIGFPAGLIDEGERPEECAIRELKEETGYTGTLRHVTTPTASSAGLTNEAVYIVMLDIDEDDEKNKDVVPELEDGEDIQTFLVHRGALVDFIKKSVRDGCMLGGRFSSYVCGLAGP